LAGGQRSRNGWAYHLWSFDILTVAAKRLHHPVVADAGSQLRAKRMAQERPLWVGNLTPLPIVADDCEHRQVMAHHGLELHAIQAKAAVAKQDRRLLLWPCELGGNGKARPCAKCAEGARIQPVSWLPRCKDACAPAHDIPTVADHIGILVQRITQLAAE